MMTYTAIVDVGVVGCADEVNGEHPMAFVVLSTNDEVTAEEIIAFKTV